MIATYGLLGLAILSVWFPPLRMTPSLRLPVWCLLLLAATISGLAAGILAPVALLPIGVFLALAWLAQRSSGRPGTPWLTRLWLLLTALMALALAMHLAPGFHNPRTIERLVLSPGGAPFTQYLNFDKGLAGLVLLALFCRKVQSWPELAAAFKRAAPAMLLTIAAVIGLALALGYVKPDLKWPAVTLQFLLVNLFLTCVAEEAFFRGFLQEKIGAFFQHSRNGELLALVVASLLFGLTHIGGGWRLALLASIAGLGYGYVYRQSKKIEAAIAAHFLLNAVQFLAFTYPFLRP